MHEGMRTFTPTTTTLRYIFLRASRVKVLSHTHCETSIHGDFDLDRSKQPELLCRGNCCPVEEPRASARCRTTVATAPLIVSEWKVECSVSTACPGTTDRETNNNNNNSRIPTVWCTSTAAGLTVSVHGSRIRWIAAVTTRMGTWACALAGAWKLSDVVHASAFDYMSKKE